MRNTLGDLNNILFGELERLEDESMSGEELELELKRAHGITNIAAQIINNANTVLKAQKIYDQDMGADAAMPKMLKGGES